MEGGDGKYPKILSLLVLRISNSSDQLSPNVGDFPILDTLTLRVRMGYRNSFQPKLSLIVSGIIVMFSDLPPGKRFPVVVHEYPID